MYSPVQSLNMHTHQCTYIHIILLYVCTFNNGKNVKYFSPRQIFRFIFIIKTKAFIWKFYVFVVVLFNKTFETSKRYDTRINLMFGWA